MNNTLKTLRAAIELRLRRHSNLTFIAMRRASTCIADLQLHGCIVQRVVVERDHVTVRIDKPSTWLHGAVRISRISSINGRYRETIKVTAVHGCQVEWLERSALSLFHQREG